MQIDIFGSCVCRDIFRQSSVKKYKIGRCISSVPITTLYSDSVPIKDELLFNMPLTDYEKRMLKVQFSKKAVNLLKKSESKILIMDLADEFMMRSKIGNTGNYEIAYYEEDEEALKKILVSEQYSPLDIDMDLIDIKFNQFVKDIIYSEDNPDGYQAKNIIVIESYYAEKLAGNDGNLHDHNVKYQVRIRNEWLHKVYTIFYKYMQECKVLKLPLFTCASENHIRGIHPLGYTSDTYEYFLNAIDVLCGKSKINSIDNLYKEQSLKNRLFQRTLNSTSIYSIKDIKKQVDILQKENLKLKKELEVMKKNKE